MVVNLLKNIKNAVMAYYILITIVLCQLNAGYYKNTLFLGSYICHGNKHLLWMKH